jgi:hypothetical protein
VGAVGVGGRGGGGGGRGGGGGGVQTVSQLVSQSPGGGLGVEHQVHIRGQQAAATTRSTAQHSTAQIGQGMSSVSDDGGGGGVACCRYGSGREPSGAAHVTAHVTAQHSGVTAAAVAVLSFSLSVSQLVSQSVTVWRGL